MGIRIYKPTSAGRRNASVSDFAELTPGYTPERSLLRPLRRSGGRNNQGKITARHRGGGHKRRYRVIDFRRDKDNVPARVASIEYDPNRSARIALLHYVDGEKRYIIAPDGLTQGMMLASGPDADLAKAARDLAARALDYAEVALPLKSEKETLRALTI